MSPYINLPAPPTRAEMVGAALNQWPQDPGTLRDDVQALVSAYFAAVRRYRFPGASLFLWGARECGPFLEPLVPGARRRAREVFGMDRDLSCARIPLVEFQRGRWLSFEFGHPRDLPRTPACYVIYLDGHPCYIGQTGNISSRFAAHGLYLLSDGEGLPFWLTPWGPLAGFRLAFKRRVPDRAGDWLMHEARLISRLHPRFNRTRHG